METILVIISVGYLVALVFQLHNQKGVTRAPQSQAPQLDITIDCDLTTTGVKNVRLSTPVEKQQRWVN